MNIQRGNIQSFLIALSLLLLMGFLVFWNWQQYKTEKYELTQQLNTQMSLACSEYRDSVVNDVFRLIRVKQSENKSGQSNFPSNWMGDGKHFEALIGSELPPDSLITEIKIVGPEFDRFSGLNDKEHKLRDSSINIILDKSISENDIIIWESNKNTSMRVNFANDIKVDTSIVWEFPDRELLGDSERNATFPMPSLYNEIDSIFSKRLTDNNIGISYDRIKSVDSLVQQLDHIFVPFEYEIFGFSQTPSAVFKNYNAYLLRKLTPNLLLSLLLFGVVALSFFFISKTWEEQLRLTKLKNEFISNMTHELNTPIATIGVAIEALENFGAMNDPIKRKEYLDISKQEVGRLKYLVDKVLKLSTLDQGYSELNKTPEDLKQLMQQAIQNLGLHLEKNKAQVDFDFRGTDFQTKLDRDHFVNVIHNLIDNAIKYSINNPRIAIKMESIGEKINIQISDNGIGIPKNYRSKIFDRFFRVPNEDRHNIKGHGLGLHYVKSIIDKHNGTIDLANSSSGTSFTITIPKQ